MAQENEGIIDPRRNEPRRSQRIPAYTKKYTNYRRKFLDGFNSEDVSDFSEAMTVGLEFFTHDHDQSKVYTPSSALLLEPYIPTSYKDALNCPDSSNWIPAIEDEYQSIMERKTWRIVPLPPGRKPIKCK